VARSLFALTLAVVGPAAAADPLVIPVTPDLLLSESPGRVPYTAADRLARGHDFRARGELTYALGEYDEAVRLAPGLAAARAGRAAVWLARRDMPRAAAEADEAVRLDPAVADAHRVRAAVHYDAGRWADALRAADDFLRLAPRDGRGYRGRAEVRAELGDRWGAVADFERALRLTPADADLWARYGVELNRLGEPDEAVAAFTRAAAGRPGNVQHLYYRAETEVARNRPADALRDLDVVVEMCRAAAPAAPAPPKPTADAPKPEPPAEPVRLAAWIYQRTTSPPATPAGPSRTSVPPPVEVQAVRAKAYHQLGDAGRSLAHLDDAIGRAAAGSPVAVWAHWGRAAARFNRGEFAAAGADLDEVVRRSPDDSLGWAARAVARAEQGRLREALADMAAADALPAKPGFGIMRGRVLALAGRHAEAAAAYRNFAEGEPRNPAGWLLAGEAEVWAGEFSAADRHLTAALWKMAPRPAPPGLFLLRAVARAMRGEWRAAVADLGWAARMIGPAATGGGWPRCRVNAPGW
jgi:tetratricopeptide (TPR) repeat protein